VLSYLLLVSLLGHAVSSFGLLLGAAVPIPILAVLLCPLTVIPFMLTSGFFINLDGMPVYLRWLVTLSPHRYAFGAMMGIEFRELQLHCDEDEISSIVLQATSAAPERFSYCSMVRGSQVLSLLSLPADSFRRSVGALLLITLVVRCIAFGVLLLQVRERRMALDRYGRRVRKAIAQYVHTIKQRRQRA
jgi:hypothetical protein